MNESCLCHDRCVDGCRDKLAFAITALISFGVYWYTLAPGLTLDRSGELITAVHTLGVPHSPGYPAWTLLAWLWQNLLPLGSIAWRINLLSAFCGAVTAGMTAMLISKSGYGLASRSGFLDTLGGGGVSNGLVLVSSVAAGLIFAFTPILWSQSVITATHTFAAMLWMWMLTLLYRWSAEPQRRVPLYLAAFCWGVGLTCHPSFVLLALAVPVFIWFVDREFVRGILAWQQMLVLCGLAIAGLCLCMFLPLISSTNPPVNWGYTRVFDGFREHVIGAPYFRIHIGRPWIVLWGQVMNVFFSDLTLQFNVVFALAALLTLLFYQDMDARDRLWLRFTLLGYVCLTAGSLLLFNPSLDKQKFYGHGILFLPAHCLYSLWIGYGLILGLSHLPSRWRGNRVVVTAAVIGVALFPMVPAWMHWSNAEQRGHDFAERLARHLFQPGHGYPDMEKNAVLLAGTDASQSTGSYRRFVEDSVSRDVYLIGLNSLADPWYLKGLQDQYGTLRPRGDKPETLRSWPLWQRGLLRFGENRLGRRSAYPSEPMVLPGETERNAAFTQLARDIQDGRMPPVEGVSVQGGKVRVEGIPGVMAVNASLARFLFEKNKDRHAFYVIGNYSMLWMYHHMEPYGLMMKLHREPVAQLDPAVIARDRQYWDALVQELIRDVRFLRDTSARHEFSNLRSAIARLYVMRNLPAEAEYAYQQALYLCPDISDPYLGLASLKLNTAQANDHIPPFHEITALLEQYRKHDAQNRAILMAESQINETQKLYIQQEQLAQLHSADPGNLSVAMKLADHYVLCQRKKPLDELVDSLLRRPEITTNELEHIIRGYAALKRPERTAAVLTVWTQRFPNNLKAWYGLAASAAAQGNCEEATRALERAIALDARARDTARLDAQFNRCREHARLQSLLGPPLSHPAPSTLRLAP